VLTCEHARCGLPFGGRVSRAERELLSTHWGWDIGGWELTRGLAHGLDTSAIGGRWSRLAIDLNRRVDDPSLIRREAGGLELSWNRRLAAPEVERRVLRFHAPYHTEVDRLIMRRLVRGVRPLLFAVHTFTPVFDGHRRRFDLGVLYERDAGLAHRLGRSLRQAGFSVRYNQPYSGMAGMMYSADRHGTHHGLPCLELEANHELFDRPARARTLERAVLAGLRELIQTGW
jgi:predicted N-formylglutamate amidohydrolase